MEAYVRGNYACSDTENALCSVKGPVKISPPGWLLCDPLGRLMGRITIVGLVRREVSKKEELSRVFCARTTKLISVVVL
jgi:hypothetical protein